MEIEARTKIALRLADVLAAHGAGPDEATALPDSGWSMVARLADCRPGYSPSEETRSLTVAVLRTRAASTPRWGADPFSVFDGTVR